MEKGNITKYLKLIGKDEKRALRITVDSTVNTAETHVTEALSFMGTTIRCKYRMDTHICKNLQNKHISRTKKDGVRKLRSCKLQTEPIKKPTTSYKDAYLKPFQGGGFSPK